MIDKPKNKGGRPKKTAETIPREYLSMTDDELSRRKKIGDSMQSVEKGRIQRIKAELASKSVIETKAVIGIVTDVFSRLKTILYSSTNTLTSRIVGKEHAEVSAIMFEFIDNALANASEDFDDKLTNLKVEEDSDHDE